jgi:hypothetical protein
LVALADKALSVSAGEALFMEGIFLVPVAVVIGFTESRGAYGRYNEEKHECRQERPDC